jgi:hypothetical protein
VPDERWRSLLDRDVARCRAQAVLLRPRIAELLLQPLSNAGVEPLVFKGAALADRYPGPGLRPMDDIDAILPAGQHGEALDVLRAAGWHALPLTPGEHHEIVLRHPALPGLPLELHHAFATWRERSSGVDSDELWQQRQPCRIEGASTFCLAPELELIAIAAHAARPRNVFRRLVWSLDVAVIISAALATGTAIDWARVAALADDWRCRTAVAVSLVHARLLGVDSPPDLRRISATGARRATLASVLADDWPTREPDAGVRHRLGYALMDDRRDQLTYFVGDATARGIAIAPFRAAAMGGRAVFRWWQLRSGSRGVAA